MRAVIADDDDDIRTLVRIAAGRAGVDVIADVADGTSAWEAMESLTPDLAILDAAMPGMSGLELCRKARQHPVLRDIRLVLLTAAAEAPARERGLAAGADEYLTKPFSPRELVSAIAAQEFSR
ncbi:response regulator transcription factor [Rathayibacter sp. KR2-224]|uniref:response regulator transcription factor n=1 Tax=Rathayibacter sp. KR2-224 TaxID=3400913 RepID=UPI003C0EADC3